MLRARREKLALPDPSVLEGVWMAAARAGILHDSREVVLAGLGSALVIDLPDGLAAAAAPAALAGVLAGVALDGPDGPGGTGVVAFGALPFDPLEPGRLVLPEVLIGWRPAEQAVWVTQVRADGAFADAAALLAGVSAQAAASPQRSDPGPLSYQPSGDGYTSEVGACIEQIRLGDVDKVVLARKVHGEAAESIDTSALLATLRAREPSCTLYAHQLGRARYVGASPELLVATSGGAVHAHPLAGTVALVGAPSDAERIAWLEGSDKNRWEHDVMVDDIVTRLSPLCDTIAVPDAPSIVALSTIAHLGTWIDGKLRGPAGPDAALRVLAAIHPTPAVGGVPRDAALRILAALEGESRGPYAGPVGWIDADGTSEWTLGIRGILVEGAAFSVWAGAGIVSDSDPGEELAETQVKLESVLRAFDS
jgi:menaquinone-specific isochorismate synthase